MVASQSSVHKYFSGDCDEFYTHAKFIPKRWPTLIDIYRNFDFQGSEKFLINWDFSKISTYINNFISITSSNISSDLKQNSNCIHWNLAEEWACMRMRNVLTQVTSVARIWHFRYNHAFSIHFKPDLPLPREFISNTNHEPQPCHVSSPPNHQSLNIRNLLFKYLLEFPSLHYQPCTYHFVPKQTKSMSLFTSTYLRF